MSRGITRAGILLNGILIGSVWEAGAIFGLLSGTQHFASRGILAGTLTADIFISREFRLLLGRLLNFLGKL